VREKSAREFFSRARGGCTLGSPLFLSSLSPLLSPVRQIKRLLHAVPVVDVDVHVQDAGVVLQQLQDGQDQVIHITKPGRFGLLRVVQAARPVNCHVGQAVIEADCARDGGARVEAAEVVEAVEDGAVLAHVEAGELLNGIGDRKKKVEGDGERAAREAGVVHSLPFSHLPRELAPGRVRRDLGQEVDVVFGVELGQLGRVRAAGALGMERREKKRG